MQGYGYVASEIDPFADRAQRIREFLRAELPEAFAEGQLDSTALRVALGESTEDRPERYLFTWAGKREAINLLRLPTRATLVPAPDESVNFDTTENLFIEGDNLEVLKLLYRAYFGRVKLIYIDPPYNTGNDFIYRDNFTDPLARYLELTGQQDVEGNLLTSNPERGGRYHSTWLSMMYPRLFLARQLLRDDGVIFISIDDHEVHNLRVLMNEVFGEENFIASVVWQKTYAPKSSAKHFSSDHEYILVYARNADSWRPVLLPRTEQQNNVYRNPDNDPRGAWRPNNLAARNFYSKGTYAIQCPSGRVVPGPPKGSYWRVSEERFWELDRDGRIWWGGDGNNVPAPKIFLSEVLQGRVPQTIWTYQEVGHSQDAKREVLEYVAFEDTDNVLDTVKPTRLIQRILQIGTNPAGDDIVLDFFAGSATTAHAVLKQNQEDGGNRRFICVQFPEPLPKPESALNTIADISKARIRSVLAEVTPVPDDTSEGEEQALTIGLGVRIFKLSSSLIRPWKGLTAPTPQEYAEQLALFGEQLRDDAESANIIWEVALKEGFPLTAHIAPVPEAAPNSVHQIFAPGEDRSFFICLDARLDAAILDALPLTKTDLFVCRDSALNDTLAANLAQQCELRTL